MIDGLACPPIELEKLLARCGRSVAAMDATCPADAHESNRPTYFEIITALALLRFADQRVDAAVLEVGMGGRLDSTNVCRPLVSVITSISFDHTQQLGKTLAAIAGEKAGIIKPRTPVVSGVLADEPREAVAAAARACADCRWCNWAAISTFAIGRRGDWRLRRPRGKSTFPAPWPGPRSHGPTWS